MRTRHHGIVYAVVGLVVLAANVIDAADRGASFWNFLLIALGAGLLFGGFTLIARSGGGAGGDGD